MGRRRSPSGKGQSIAAAVRAVVRESRSAARDGGRNVVVRRRRARGARRNRRRPAATLERRVVAMPRYHEPLRIEWVGLPSWLAAPSNQHIVADLTESCGLTLDDRLLDPQLAQRIGERVAAADVAWIAALERVEIRPEGVLAIHCKYRNPMAWVRPGAAGRVCYLVGDDGVRLPGAYPSNEVVESTLVIVEGVSGEVPPVGEPWHAADVYAAFVSFRPAPRTRSCRRFAACSSTITAADATRSAPRSSLRPTVPPRAVWWGRAPGEESGCEISTAQKVALLESLYRQSGRIDMNRSYVNVTTWPDRVSAPATGEAMASQSEARG